MDLVEEVARDPGVVLVAEHDRNRPRIDEVELAAWIDQPLGGDEPTEQVSRDTFGAFGLVPGRKPVSLTM